MPEQTANPIASLLDGDVAERVRRLEVFSRQRVAGSRIGDNRSRLLGHSPEFVQHRPYQRGDNVRHIDWRVMAKTDRVVVKRFEEFTNARCTIILDVSGSMGYRADGLSKHEFAVRCAGVLAYLACEQSDSLALCAFADGKASWVPSGSGRAHLARVFEALVTSSPTGGTELRATLDRVQQFLPPRSLVAVVSDFMDEPSALAGAMGGMRVRGHDVMAFQVFDPTEAELDFVDMTQFIDMEDNSTIQADPLMIRDDYRRLFREHQAQIKTSCLAMAVDHCLLPVADEFDAVIGSYLVRRAALFR